MNSRLQVPQPGRQPRLLDQVRDTVRRKHYSYRTEKAYLHWIRRVGRGAQGVASPMDAMFSVSIHEASA